MSMNILFETERLQLRPFSLDDAKEMYLLNLDREVLQYTGDVSFKSIAAAKSFLKNYDQYSAFGMGRWATLTKDGHHFIGWCGLKYWSAEEGADIGFRLHKKYWGKGYATEAASACLAYGFLQLGLHRIIGRAKKENKASIRVMEKIGMKFQYDFLFEGDQGVMYLATKNDFDIGY